LYKQSKHGGQKDLYAEETRRIIILYVISAIEAILLYLYKERGESLEKIEYKYAHALPEKFLYDGKDGLPVVIAVQQRVPRKEYEIGLRELVYFFETKNLMKKETARDILDMNDVRNTFHFNKPRTKSCEINRVEKAMHLLVYTMERAPKTLHMKK